MNWAPRSRDGRRDNGSVSAGLAGRTTRAPNAVVDVFFTATTSKLPASATTEDISNTCSLRLKHWQQYRTHLAMPKQPRCCAQESPPLMACATAVRYPAIWLRCKVSGVLVTSEFNLPTSLDTRSRPLGVVAKPRPWRKNSGQAYTSTAKRQMRPRNCKNWRRTGNSVDSTQLKGYV